MKRCLLLLLSVAFIFSLLPSASARAAQENYSYLKVESDNVILYADRARPDSLFILPRTFYVKLLESSYTETYHRVEYNGVEGLVKVSDFPSPPEENVVNPYYTSTFISAHIDTKLYKYPSFSKAGSRSEIDANGLSLLYLGKVNGEKGTFDTPVWFAVLYVSEVYYLHCAQTNDLSLLESSFAPIHPNSVVKSDDAASVSGSESSILGSESGFDLLRLLLVIGMIVPLLIIVFLLFKPKRRPAPPRDRRYDDRDRYDDYYDD